MANKIAIANHKGGCGKTATAQALAQTLADDHGQRVLLVDMDPQSSLTEACGVKVLGRDKTMADVLGGSRQSKDQSGDQIRGKQHGASARYAGYGRLRIGAGWPFVGT